MCHWGKGIREWEPQCQGGQRGWSMGRRVAESGGRDVMKVEPLESSSRLGSTGNDQAGRECGRVLERGLTWFELHF